MGDRAAGSGGMFERYFRLSDAGTNVRTEVLAGLTTFVVMSYIIFVNPNILSTSFEHEEGLAVSAVMTATCLVAGVMTIVMGIVTNKAYAIAPGLGLNAIVAFTLVGQEGLTYAQAMGVIIAQGILITALVVLGVRKWVMDAVPLELKKGIAVGIGLFILFIGLQNGGIIVSDPATFVTLGDLRGAPVLVTVVGLFLTIALIAKGVKAAILIGIVVSTLFAIVVEEIAGTGQFIPGQAQIPSGIIATPDFSIIGNFSFGFIAEMGLSVAILTILAIMLADFFDTMGTLVGVGSQAGYLDENGDLPDAQNALLVDSLGAVAGGAVSASSATTYIESASGVSQGGRTGLVAIVVGVLFLLAMPFTPLVEIVPASATASALIIVGWMMTSVLSDREDVTSDGRIVKTTGVDFANIEIGLPVLVTMMMMPLTFNITNGIGAGFIVWTAIKVFRGKFKDIHPAMYIVSVAFIIYFLRTYLGVDA